MSHNIQFCGLPHMTALYYQFIFQLNTVKDCRSHQIKRLYNTSLRLFFNTPVLADVIFKIQGKVPLLPLPPAFILFPSSGVRDIEVIIFHGITTKEL